MPRNRARSPAANQPATKSQKVSITTLPPMHESQLALVKRAIKAIKRNDNKINFQVVGYVTEDGKGKPGAGKTRIVGAIVRYWGETKFVALGGPVVTMFSAANTKLAVEHVEDIGARRVMTPFQSDKTKRLAAELNDNGHAVISMTRTMMHMLFNTTYNEHFELLKNFIEITGVKAILLVIDEAHLMYKDPSKFPTVIQKARDCMHIPIEVMGVTATPGLTKQASIKGVTKLYGLDEQPFDLVYKADQYTQLMTDTKILPDSPTTWETIQIPSPVGDNRLSPMFVELHDGIVNLLCAEVRCVLKPGEDNMIVSSRDAIKITLSKMIVAQIHGEDGGILIDTVTRGDIKIKIATGGTETGGAKPSGEPIGNPKESVMIMHTTSQAENMHIALLESLEATNPPINSNPLSVHNLLIEPRKLNEQRVAMQALDAAFKAQTATTLAVIPKSMHEGHNACAKSFTTGAAFGPFSNDELIQGFGRMGRMGAMVGNGTPVPVEYKAVHFVSAFGEQVMNIDKKPTGLRSIKLAEMVEAKLKDLKAALIRSRKGNANETIDTNIKKLVKADEFLLTNNELALNYIKALWDEYKLSEDEQVGSTEGEEDAEDDDDDEDEEDAEGEEGEEGEEEGSDE